MIKTPTPLLQDTPLTAEGRQELLKRLFGEEIPHPGELFIPDDDFYLANVAPRKRAAHMIRKLCGWLGVKPGYVGLYFDQAGTTKEPAGKRHTIFIDARILKDEFLLGAYLANSLTQYLVEERKRILLADINQQAALLANASVLFGFSVVVLNGFCMNKKSLLRRHTYAPILLKGYPYADYLQLSQNYFRKYQIDPLTYSHCLAPKAVKALHIPSPLRLTRAIHDLRHQVKARNMKLVGACWLLLLLLGICSFTLLQRVKPTSSVASEAQQKVLFLNELVRACREALAYDRKYADFGDIQAVRALNAQELRCQGLENQYESANQEYRELVE